MKRYVYLLIIGFILLFIYNLRPLRETFSFSDVSGEIIKVELVTSDEEKREREKEKEKEKEEEEKKRQQQQKQQQRNDGYSGQPDTIPPQTESNCEQAARNASSNHTMLTTTIPAYIAT